MCFAPSAAHGCRAGRHQFHDPPLWHRGVRTQPLPSPDRRQPHQGQLQQLDDAQLRHAVELAERIEAEGDLLLRRLNKQSLLWRGHLPVR